MKTFIVLFEHKEYGRYSWKMEGYVDIKQALDYFIDNHSYKYIYGIFEI